MNEDVISILPCNGLDKSLGVITREVALNLIGKKSNFKLICPVLLNSGDKKYDSILHNSKTVVINGCMTRCPMKLLEQHDLKPFKQIMIPNLAKKYKIKPSSTLFPDEGNMKLAGLIADEIIAELDDIGQDKTKQTRNFQEQDYFDITVDKYYFKVPKSGYFFNENDSWIKPNGKSALLGISDYLQNAASDIMFVELPEVGTIIEQFDDVCSFESVKTVLQLISPGSGKIISINRDLEQNPEYLNQDPYNKGWIVEIELINFEEDKDLLLNGLEYFEYMKEKVSKEKR